MRLVPLVLVVLVLAGCTSAPSAPSGVSPTTPSGGATAPTSPSPADDWATYHGDAARTGLAHRFPAPGKPRLVANLRLDAAVYASPIVGGGVTFVATENDSVYALDDDGRQVWTTNLGAPVPRSDLPCGNIDPSGITGTPVYANGVVYVVAELGDPVRHDLVALSARDGTVRWRAGVDLPGTDPVAMQERGALAIDGGRVWVPFGGRFGDCGDYRGRVVGVRLDGTDPIAYTVPTSREAGIWAPPGVVVGSSDDMFVAVGNGEHGPGDSYDHSDSVLRLTIDAKLVDSFSPTNWASDNASDLDLGSQGPTLVGKKWVFIAGKSGTGYVLRASHLGGVGGSVWHGAVCRSFGGTALDGATVYVPCDDGVRAVRIDDTGTAHVTWHASVPGSPVVGGGRVWALDPDAGVLHALDPASGRSTAKVAVGATSRFATPALHGNHVLVPTLTGLAVVAVR